VAQDVSIDTRKQGQDPQHRECLVFSCDSQGVGRLRLRIYTSRRTRLYLRRGSDSRYSTTSPCSCAVRPRLNQVSLMIHGLGAGVPAVLQLTSRQPRHLPLRANFQHVETKLQTNHSASSGINFSSHLIINRDAYSTRAQNHWKAARCVKARSGS
jgi:hypothetical protein